MSFAQHAGSIVVALTYVSNDGEPRGCPFNKLFWKHCAQDIIYDEQL